MPMEKFITIRVPYKWQGTLKSILEREGREFINAARDQGELAGKATTDAWIENAKRCFEISAQLKRR